MLRRSGHADERLLGVAGHEQDPDLRPRARDALRNLVAAHPRHDDVGEEEIDPAVLGLGERDRGMPVGAREHGVALPLEHAPRQVADDVLVLDQQDRLRAGPRCRLGRLDDGAGQLEDAWQGDPEHRAAPGELSTATSPLLWWTIP